VNPSVRGADGADPYAHPGDAGAPSRNTVNASSALADELTVTDASEIRSNTGGGASSF